MQERRSDNRSRTLKTGKVVFNQRMSVLDCVIKNLSERGASLQFAASTISVPERFELIVPGNNQRRDCNVIWRQGERIGVVFPA